MNALRHIDGTTLIELMTTVSVVAVTLGLGVPTFNTLQAGMHRGEVTAELMTAFTLARSEAARRGVPVTICASSDGQTCAGDDPPNWNSGWIVFTDRPTDPDAHASLDPATDEILRVSHFEHTGFTLTTPPALAYGATLDESGYADPTKIGSFRYCDDREYQDLSLSYIGRLEITVPRPGCP